MALLHSRVGMAYLTYLTFMISFSTAHAATSTWSIAAWEPELTAVAMEPFHPDCRPKLHFFKKQECHLGKVLLSRSC